MLINVDENQNKRVEELLDEGIANLEINNNIKLSSRINNKYNYKNTYNHIKFNNNIGNSKQSNNYNNNNFNNNINNISDRPKHNYIYYNGLNTDLIDNTIEALNTGLYNSDDGGYCEQNLVPKNSQNIYIKKKANYNKEEKIVNNNSKKDNGLNINNEFNNENEDINNINPSNNVDNNPIKIKNYEENSDENIYKEQMENNHPIINNENIYNVQMQNNIQNENIEFNNINNTNLTNLENNDIKEPNNEGLTTNKTSKKHRTKKAIRNYDWKEKYDEVKKLSKNILKELNIIQKENKNIEKRLDNYKNNSENVNEIKSNLLKKQINYDKINNKYKISENIRMKQIELIEKITKEMKYVKQLLFKEQGFK